MKVARFVLAAFALAGGACGPSFQAIYEGNARFEHCYALEENPNAPLPQKGDCWRDWSEHYTYGQTRDRTQYAIARYVALTQASVPTDEALMMAAPGVTPRVSTITAPAPTNAFAPPPKVLDQDAGSAPPLRPSERNAVLGDDDAGAAPVAVPGAACQDACQGTYRTCQRACSDAGKNGCSTCEKKYRGCMRACFP